VNYRLASSTNCFHWIFFILFFRVSRSKQQSRGDARIQLEKTHRATSAAFIEFRRLLTRQKRVKHHYIPKSFTAIFRMLGHSPKKKHSRTLVGTQKFQFPTIDHFANRSISDLSSITMGRYKEVALQMSVLGVRDRTIRRYTGISE